MHQHRDPSDVLELAERAYDELNRSIGHEVYRQAAREDVTLEALAQSADPLQQLIYRKVVERLEGEPDKDAAAQPVRRLSDDMKAQVEAAFLDGYRVFRDRQLMLRAVDSLWVRHLTDLDELREGIRLRAYGQQNPLVAYRKEAFEMYEALLVRVQEMVARSVYLVPQALVVVQTVGGVVGVQDRHLGRPGQAGTAHEGDVGPRDRQDAGRAPGGGRHGVDTTVDEAADGPADLAVAGQERDQVLGDSDGTDTGATATVGDAEGLVQVQVGDIGTESAGPGHTDEGVEVGPVEIDLAANHSLDRLSRIRANLADHMPPSSDDDPLL